MRFIWRVLSNLILVLVFIVLSVFSLVEYRSDNLNVNTTDDKLPLAKTTFTGLSHLIAYLEQMPTIRLLPVASSGLEYQKQALAQIDQAPLKSLVNKSNIKEEIPILKSQNRSEIIDTFNLKNIIKRLKEQLTKDWSRP